MARMPGTDWQGERSPKVSMARYDAVCVHTIVGFAPAHAAHFSTKANGQIIQSRDTRYRSGANLEGNHRIIAIENEDHGSAFGSWNTNDGHAVPAMTAAQVEANAKILAWAHKTHGVPLQLCPNSKPTSRGLAYHRQGIKGNWSSYKYGGWVSGGEIWTTSPGKVCPGDRRIAQLPAILARAKQIVNGDDDMPTAKEIADAVWAKALTSEVSNKAVSARTLLQKAHLYSYGARRAATYPLGSADGPTPRQAWSRAEARTSALLALVAEIIDRDPSTPLTGDQVKAIVEKAIQDNVVKVDVTIEGAEPEPTES